MPSESQTADMAAGPLHIDGSSGSESEDELVNDVSFLADVGYYILNKLLVGYVCVLQY